MFTIEHVFDHTVVTILDDAGHNEDLEVQFDEHTVFLRQWNELAGGFDVIEVSVDQFKDLLISITKAEGAWRA
jgi:hypothetical protein